ncbi:MAG: zinc ribbon domain-containing protein, partial [Asgard group archaeon]|nr:zinc ribbon domain-containing protein [Asgard group archaeon]
DKKSKFCSHCGTTVKSDDVFCNNCGASLEDIIEPAVSMPAQPEPYTQTTHTSQATVYVPPPKTQNSVATVALIFGIVSVVINLFPFSMLYIGIITGTIGVITGIIGGLKSQKKILAYIGLGLGVIGITLWVLAYFGVFRFWGFWW